MRLMALESWDRSENWKPCKRKFGSSAGDLTLFQLTANSTVGVTRVAPVIRARAA
jgi:hypothetical protein